MKYEHLDEERMDAYSMGLLPETDCSSVEEHLLLCEACRQRLEADETFLHAIRLAAVGLKPQPEKRRWISWPRMYVLLAASAGALALVAMTWMVGGSRFPAAEVSLRAMRGDEAVHAPARRPLELKLDLSDLPALPAYHVQVVDQYGNEVADAVAKRSEVRIGGLRPGGYFVRVYAPQGPLLREFSLDTNP